MQKLGRARQRLCSRNAEVGSQESSGPLGRREDAAFFGVVAEEAVFVGWRTVRVVTKGQEKLELAGGEREESEKEGREAKIKREEGGDKVARGLDDRRAKSEK